MLGQRVPRGYVSPRGGHPLLSGRAPSQRGRRGPDGCLGRLLGGVGWPGHRLRRQRRLGERDLKTATNTAGTPITVGTNPVAIAITP